MRPDEINLGGSVYPLSWIRKDGEWIAAATPCDAVAELVGFGGTIAAALEDLRKAYQRLQSFASDCESEWWHQTYRGRCHNIDLRAPFPWFGGKSRAAPLIWPRLGADVANYVEPFFGSGAVLLSRPYVPANAIETVNDLDCMVANFWRAVAMDAETVWQWADWPVNEADLETRHLWLVKQKAGLRDLLGSDPDAYDARIAGYWVWGICAWIGGGWCAGGQCWDHDGEKWFKHTGHGVDRKRPPLGNAGRGIKRQLPHLGNASPLTDIAQRMLRVRVCCGDWTRVLGPSPTTKLGITAVVLDPPYSHDMRRSSLYAEEMPVADAVRQWAIDHGENPKLRIVLCGYEGEHEMPASWETVAWKTNGGYGSQSDGRGRENATKERLWFSPHCLRDDAPVDGTDYAQCQLELG